MTVEDVLSQVKGVRRNGASWMSKCPLHDDRTPSLSISEAEDGKVLFHCHAGCSNSDLAYYFQPEQQEPEAVYTYTDEQDEPLYEVVRFPGKKFRQRTPDGDWGLRGKNVRRVLYALHDLMVDTIHPVYVVEGEKDVHALAQIEAALVTCNVGGAGKWREEYSESLRGREVIIVADADEPGIEHAKDVASSLANVASAVNIVLPKVGKDASDHLAAGFGVEDFVKWDGDIYSASRSTSSISGNGLSVTFANTIRAEEHEFLDDDERVPMKRLTILAGMPGLGKSTLACFYCARTTKMGNVAFYSTYEDDPASTLKPRMAAAGADLDKVAFLGGLVVPDRLDELDAVLVRYKPSLLVLDPLSSHLGGEVDSYHDQKVRQALDPLNEMARRHNMAIIVLMHLNKQAYGDPQYRVGGSLAGIQGPAGSAMLLDKDDGDEFKLSLIHFKSSYTERKRPTSLVRQTKQIDLDGKTLWVSEIVRADSLVQPVSSWDDPDYWERAAGLVG